MISDGSSSEVTAEEPAPERAAAPSFGSPLRGRFRYRLIKRLGRGSFGSVFFARCLDHDRRRDDSPPERVAIKIVLLCELADSRSVARYRGALSRRALGNARVETAFGWRPG